MRSERGGSTATTPRPDRALPVARELNRAETCIVPAVAPHTRRSASSSLRADCHVAVSGGLTGLRAGDGAPAQPPIATKASARTAERRFIVHR